MTKYYDVHCPECGNVTTADMLAFDFGRLFDRAIKKASAKASESGGKWLPMLKLDPGFYYKREELEKIFGLKDGSVTHIVFTVRHLREHLAALAEAPFETIADLTDVNNQIYARLVRTIKPPRHEKSGIRQHIDIMEHAENIRTLAELCSARSTMDENEPIAEFDVKVFMEEDDQGNQFPGKMAVIYEDDDQENVVNTVCPHCGKRFHSMAGKYQEIIICLAGSPHPGKEWYLAALINAIEKYGSKFVQRIYWDPDFRILCEKYINSYRKQRCILKASLIRIGETIPLFSVPIRVLDRSYLFTFLDMPGEAFDDENLKVDMEEINNDANRIIKYARMFWFFVEPAQIWNHVAFENHTASGDQILAVKKYQRFIENIRQTLEHACQGEKKYAAVIVTNSNLILAKDGVNSLFRPDEHAFRDHVREDRSMDFDLVKEFAHKSYAYLDRADGIVSGLSGMFEDFTSFAIAAYGMYINPFTDELLAMPGEQNPDHEYLPSMVELPFLWTAAVLGLIPATKTVDEWVPPKKIGPVTIRSGYYVRYLAQVSRRELFVK